MKFEFELYNTKQRKEMISSNDRLHYQKKAKLTANLRALARFKTKGSVKVPYSTKKPCGVNVTFLAPTKRKYDPPNFISFLTGIKPVQSVEYFLKFETLEEKLSKRAALIVAH